MDNPTYLYPRGGLEAADMSLQAAKEMLDKQLSLLTSQLTPEASPSQKVKRKVSLRRIFSGRLKRSQSLTQEDSKEDIEVRSAEEFFVERSKSFSSSSWTNPKQRMSHDENYFRKRVSSGPVCLQQHLRTHQAFDAALDHDPNIDVTMATASTLHITRQRPPLPPNRSSCSQLKSEDFLMAAQIRQQQSSKKPRTSPKPHVLHRQCSLGSTSTAAAAAMSSSNQNPPDVAIVFSSRCQVSGEWSQYMTNLAKSRGFKDIIVQDVEAFSLLASKTYDPVSLDSLRVKEELVFHAKAQIVILGQSFLDWIYAHPGLIIGNLFKDSTKVIGLLLGITKENVLPEHRAELLTYAVWKFMFTIKPEDHDALTMNVLRALTAVMTTNTTHQPNSASYVLPRPMKKFKVWPESGAPADGKILLILSEKISGLERLVIQLESVNDEKAKVNVKDFKIIYESMIEVTIPDYVTEAMKIRLEIGGIRWQPDPDCIIKAKPDPLAQFDQYLSSYLRQMMESGSMIEVLEVDKKCPTLLHFTVKRGMKKCAKTIFDLPGGMQMSLMTNEDGLNAREMAVQAGDLELAKMFKMDHVPRDYEFPVLIRPRERAREAASPEEVYFYDVPRITEDCYMVPPPPRPVSDLVSPKAIPKNDDAQTAASEIRQLLTPATPPKENSSSYVPMLHRTSTNMSQERPLSRHELISSLRRGRASSNSLDDLHEPFNANPVSIFESLKFKLEGNLISLDEFEQEFRALPEKGVQDLLPEFESIIKAKRSVPKSPLSIVNPFPLVEPQSSTKVTKLFTETQDELMELQIKFRKGLLNLHEIQSKFLAWKSRPEVVTNHDKLENERMTKKWEKLLSDLKSEHDKEEEKADGFFKANFLRKMKKKKKSSPVLDLKYSTLPSLPLRLKKARSSSTTSVTSEEAKPVVQSHRVKSCSLSESSSVANFESDSSWSAETTASAVEKLASRVNNNNYAEAAVVMDKSVFQAKV